MKSSMSLAKTAPILSQVLSRLRFLSIYSELAKARLTFLVLVTTFVGFFMAVESSFRFSLLLFTLVGTTLTAAGANGLNQWWEIRRDASMERTQGRPLPTGRCGRHHAFRWSLFCVLFGVLLLWGYVNALTALLALSVVFIYVFMYTPLKPITPLCTLVGGVCGAIPPMMGWTAVTNSLSYQAWLLGALLFVWQIPHFLSLAWLYREDYERGGFCMLPMLDPQGRMTCNVILVYSLALIPIGLAFYLSGMASWIYAAVALFMGVAFVILAVQLYIYRDRMNARKLFLASLLYLPLLMGFMVADRGESMTPRSYPSNESQRVMASDNALILPLENRNPSNQSIEKK